MSIRRPILYYDLGSPYAYLAVNRATDVLGVEPHLEPILVGGIFVERGYGSWAHTEEREQRLVELEARAADYGTPPFVWPLDWPNNTLTAMRAAVWADSLGEGRRFAVAAFGRAFGAGADLSRLDELMAVVASLRLPENEFTAAIDRPETKEALREATARAWDHGVRGVPCVELGGEIFYGDDRLEAAARHSGGGGDRWRSS